MFRKSGCPTFLISKGDAREDRINFRFLICITNALLLRSTKSTKYYAIAAHGVAENAVRKKPSSFIFLYRVL
jgi:hypothetical protein